MPSRKPGQRSDKGPDPLMGFLSGSDHDSLPPFQEDRWARLISSGFLMSRGPGSNRCGRRIRAEWRRLMDGASCRG